MDSNTLIFNMPFDESKGSSYAYDYTSNRADGELLNGAEIVQGVNGNAVKFANGAHCDVDKTVLVLGDNDFTISFMVKNDNTEIVIGSPSMVIILLNFGGINEYEELNVDLKMNVWQSVILVKSGMIYTLYLDGNAVKEVYHNGTLEGISFNQDFYNIDMAMGTIDSVKIYDVSLKQNSIMEELNDEIQQRYTIDGVDFKDYGVCVSGSSGIIDRPQLKTQKTASWDSYNGISVDLNNKYFEARTITLDCFIAAGNKVDFIVKLNKFYELFENNGTQRLMIAVHPTKVLVYEVFLEDGIPISKTFNKYTNVGKFPLKLIEPSPVKRVLKHICSGTSTNTCTISMHTDKMVNIYWGDGTVDYDINGDVPADDDAAIQGDISISHTYSSVGDYYPIIAGCINEITEFTTNAIILWNKL